MKSLFTIIAMCAVLTSISLTANAERLEVGLAFTPTVVLDEGYEAFSSDDLATFRLGADLRVLAASPGGFNIIPFVSYRFATDSGRPFYLIDTDLVTHDLTAGLRVSRALTSFLAVFAEASGGLLIADISGSPYDDSSAYYYGSSLPTRNYSDRQMTWMVQGLAGLEIGIPKQWLVSRGVNKFGFAMEIAFGYTGRGDLNFEPSLEKVDQNQIATETQPWGQINMSGWTTQVAASFKFF